jgi:hypothetical protein
MLWGRLDGYCFQESTILNRKLREGLEKEPFIRTVTAAPFVVQGAEFSDLLSRYFFMRSLHDVHKINKQWGIIWLSACFNFEITRKIAIKFGIGNLQQKLSHKCNFNLRLTKINLTLHETRIELHRFSQNLLIIQEIYTKYTFNTKLGEISKSNRMRICTMK